MADYNSGVLPASDWRERNLPRLLGFLPLSFFIAHFTHHLNAGAPQHILWLCNISNLVLATGLFFRVPLLIRMATMWLIPGVPLWLIDMSRTGDAPISTFLSHLGGLSVGIFALSRVRAERNMWIYAWIYGFFIQMICRMFTPPELNVNVAFQIYKGFDRIFHVYWHYWIFNAVLSATVLWILGIVLSRIFPQKKEDTYVGMQTETA
jgi:multidrug transporter EmrE-like cation transporter